MISVTKVFNISYMHRIMNHPGKCQNYHGHNGRIEVTVSGPLGFNSDMVIDFDTINSTIGNWIKNNLDHKSFLKDEDPLLKHLPKTSIALFDSYPLERHPTAEVLAEEIYKKTQELLPNFESYKVRFYETEDNYAEVS